MNVLVLIKKYLELKNAYAKVGLVEFVRIVPAYRAELPSLLNNRVEETQGEEHLLEGLGLPRSLVEFGIADGILKVAEIIELFTAKISRGINRGGE